MLSSGKSIPPMTPRPPPGGMVLPNAFGLMSMKSFKRSSSSKGAGTQVCLCCSIVSSSISPWGMMKPMLFAWFRRRSAPGMSLDVTRGWGMDPCAKPLAFAHMSRQHCRCE